MQTSTFFKFLAQVLDLIILNLLSLIYFFTYKDFVYDPQFLDAAPYYWLTGNCTYIISLMLVHVILYNRIVRPEKIVSRIIKTLLIHIVLFLSVLNFLKLPEPQFYMLATFYFSAFCFICMGRLMFRKKIKIVRTFGKDVKTAILIGTGDNINEMADIMLNPWNGYHLLGIFSDEKDNLMGKTSHLGKVNDCIRWLTENKVDNVYCGLPSLRADDILPIINYCENNLIHFFIIPSYRNYLKRQMVSEPFGEALVLAIRKEPLEEPQNRFFKRAFDFAFSSLFLCTLYPFLYIILSIAIKISSPGPVYFKQERTGIDGKNFKCLKFRSMKVNKECDKLQATKDDPRKTRFGDFLRRSNLDELPQLINIWKGEMSFVGPRPHMLKHTEMYSRLINQYMVRQLVKPGLTGWAQINGYRGETRELADMQHRVECDIWYLENWTFFLDIYILYKTFINMIKGEKNAY